MLKGTLITLVLAILVFLIIDWFFDEPVPDGWSNAWKVRFHLTVVRASLTLVSVPSRLGLVQNPTGFQRWLGDLIVPASLSTRHLNDVADTHDEELNGIKYRVFHPRGVKTEQALPGLIYLHGGSWVYFSVDIYDSHIRRFVKDLKVVAVAPEYRLAPEYPYPAAFDDCVAVTKHFLSNGKKYGVDTSRVILAGDSAGGNLAAAVALRLRDEGFQPQLKLQLLIYPALQFVDFHTPSYQHNDGIVLTKAGILGASLLYTYGHTKYLDNYLNNTHVTRRTLDNITQTYMPVDVLPDDGIMKRYRAKTADKTSEVWENIQHLVLDHYLSPLLAANLTNVAPAYISVCQHDVLRDDGLFYAERLKNAGISVKLDLFDIGFHGWALFPEDLKESNEHMHQMNEFIKANL